MCVIFQNNPEEIPTGSVADTTHKPRVTVMNGRHVFHVQNNPTNQQNGPVGLYGFPIRMTQQASKTDL